MSAIDEMEERNEKAAYEHGYADGQKAERERVLDEVKTKLLKLQELFAQEEMADGSSLRISQNMGAARVAMQAALKLTESLRGKLPTPPPKFNSTELLLLAHDEWKRREERKHRDEYIISESQLYTFLEWLSHKKYQDCDVDSLIHAIRNNSTEGRWVSGFLGGFCTSKHWAREWVDKIQKDAEEKHGSRKEL